MADRSNPANSSTSKKAAAKATASKRSTGSRKAAASVTKAEAPKEALNGTGLPRLGKGGLEALVLGHLKQHPKADFSSTELSNLLNRSNGAIQNALEKFAKAGTAKRVSDRPRRYRYAGDRAAAKANGTKKAAAKKKAA